MPMKCIDQMPPPMAIAPAADHARRVLRFLAATIRPEVDSATQDARIGDGNGQRHEAGLIRAVVGGPGIDRGGERQQAPVEVAHWRGLARLGV